MPKSLKPTTAEKDAITAMKLPRFVDRKNVLVVKDELTGDRTFVVDQELPAFLRRNNIKRYTVHNAERKVGRREMRDVKRRAKGLCYRTRVKEGEIIELPGAQGERLFFKIVRRGWFHARYFDVPTVDGIKRRLAIDDGPGAAQIEAGLDLYEGFREVKGG